MNETDHREPPHLSNTSRFWIPLLVVSGLWILFAIGADLYSGLNAMPLSYTEFKKHIIQGNVQKIVMKGDEVRGELVNPIPDGAQASRPFRSFSTTLPPVKDQELIPLLEKHQVMIEAESSDSTWWEMVLIAWLPWILIFGLIFYANKKMQERVGGMGGNLFGMGQSRAKRHAKSESDVHFKDVAGLENAKQDLQEIIDYLKDPSKFLELGAELPKGMLLLGPPGTGKTLLARACAGEADVPFFTLSGSEFIEMFVGVGASRVRDLFGSAKKEAPSIIFIDEIDSIGRARGTGLGGGHDEREQTLNQILSEMDGFSPHDAVVVMAATNRPDVLDAALTRPGRFDRQVVIDLPDKRGRKEMLNIHTQKVPMADNVDLDTIARSTAGLSGADLKNLVNEAALYAGRNNRTLVEEIDFEYAHDKVLVGAEREDIIAEEEKQVIAYHESGHALIAKLMPHADPLRKVSIIPRGRALGATEQIPTEDRHNLSQSYLHDRIAVMLGGRVAEKLTFQEYTTGAANDLNEATKLARRMVCQWGMSERIGPVACKLGEEHVFLGKEIGQEKDFSEYTAQIIDEEVRSLIQDIEGKVEDALLQNQEGLKALAKTLLEHETVSSEEVDDILKQTLQPQCLQG